MPMYMPKCEPEEWRMAHEENADDIMSWSGRDDVELGFYYNVDGEEIEPDTFEIFYDPLEAI